MRTLSLTAILLTASAACMGSELSASEVTRHLGVPIAKVTKEPSRGAGKGTDITYLTANGTPVLLLYVGPSSNWPSTRDAVAGMSKPFSGISQAYIVESIGMICAPGAATFVCATPSEHYMMTGTKPSGDAMRAIIKASL